MDIDYHRKLLAFGKYLEKLKEPVVVMCCKTCANNEFAGSPQTVHCREAALQTCPDREYHLWERATELNIVKEPTEFIQEKDFSI